MVRLFNRPVALVLVLTALVLSVGHRALFVRQDNSPDVFFSADEDSRRTYEQLARTFGGDEFVLVQLRGARLDRPQDLLATARLARQLGRLTGAAQVISPVELLLDPEEEEGPRLPEPIEVAQIEREVKAAAIYRKVGVYHPEIPALGAAVQLKLMLGPESRTLLAAQLDQIAARLSAAGYRPLVAGLAPANAAIDREARRSLKIFMPLVVAMSLGIGLLLFRSARAVLALFLPVGGAVLIGVAGLELAGESLNLVTGVMPPLVLAVGFAGAIHITSRYAACLGDGLAPRQAMERTIRDKIVPTTFAFGTTALGFGSLMLSEVHAVRVLGAAAAGALAAAVVLVPLGTPAFLLLLAPRLQAPPHRRQILERLASISLRWRWPVLGFTALLVALAALGIRQLESSTDGMEMLPSDAPERVTYRRLEREGTGLGNVDLWLKIPVPDERSLLKNARGLERLAAALDASELVSASIGVHDLLKLVGFRLNGRYEIPASLAPMLAMDDEYRRALDRRLSHLWHRERGLKLTLLIKTPRHLQLDVLKGEIRAAAAREFPGAPVAISGHFTMLLGTPGVLIRTLGESLGVTVAVVTVLFLIAFRSLRLTLGGMLANLLPVGLVIGGMGWLKIPLDAATVMTGSIAFGIAVDDTFHYLYHRRKSGSIIRAANVAGQGIVATSIVIMGGFSVLLISGFPPVVRFGALTAAAVVLALGVDALLLPALVGGSEER